jgi:acetyl-CoA acetyltransferase
VSKAPIAKIAGLGLAGLSRSYERGPADLALEAIFGAVADAGLTKRDIDGIIINRSDTSPPGDLPLSLIDELGMRELGIANVFASHAACGVQMVQYAAMAVSHGMARNVVCVFADTPILPERRGGDAYAIDLRLMHMPGWDQRYGLYGAVGAYGLAMRRYMAVNRAGPEAFGHVAIAQREWARLNPRAFMTSPLGMDEYLNAKPVVEPLRILDCAFPVNGAGAVVVAALESPAGAAGTAYIWGMGQGHRSYMPSAPHDNETDTPARASAATAYRMAGIGASQISHAQIYDAFTLTTLLGLEGYGLAPRGQGGAFVASGATRPGGALPVNTGGGQLTGY